MDIELIKFQAEQFLQHIIEWAGSPQFYAQCAMIAGAIVLAVIVSKFLKRYFKAPTEPIQAGTMGKFREYIYQLRGILFPLFAVLLLGVEVELSNSTVQQSWLVRIAQGLTVVALIYSIISHHVESDVVKKT